VRARAVNCGWRDREMAVSFEAHARAGLAAGVTVCMVQPAKRRDVCGASVQSRS